MNPNMQRLRNKGLITRGQAVTYAPQYLEDPAAPLRKAIGHVVKMMGEVPFYPGFIEVDFGPHGTFVGTLSAIAATPRLVYSSAHA